MNGWERQELSKRDRSLVTVTALIAGGNTEQLPFHLKRARENGVTDAELIETAMSDQMKAAGQAEALDAMLKEVPIGRIGRAEEIADVVLWLCSSASSMVIGQAIAADGGYTVC
jgi:NAD(P)-dependent dehydrogenase (short-subunit alcohol dehydrogenase family)